MAHRLRTVGGEFVDSAPMRLVFAAEVSAPPDVVYRALADDVASWPSWFTAVTRATPTEGGAGREVRLRGGVHFRETIVAAEPGTCYAYRVDESNAPGLRALLEEWRLTPEGSGTRVRWTFAADGTGPFRFVLSLARAGLGRSFRDAMRRLDARLAAPAP
ncbi:SRPBCC family protein [Streptomyces sp. NPDC058576]|uniref:SRPBCC family protein n=1 Tax=Streptomyces sp. NPDC058576 TaxID=3346547 RepID=UPI0036688900